jgi:group II intron reverse transcriptase/maturase
MDEQGKSDGPVVPTKSPNKAAPAAAEAMEGRGPADRNTRQADAARTQRRTTAQSGLARVREAAKRDRKARLSALLHHVTVERLQTAFESLHKKAAAGVDGVTWAAYAQDLGRNIQDLHARLQRGAYRAKPSRRVYIPKADGRQRPLGISSLEDKLVQRAVVEVLNAIYETDFLGFSYGFRPGRGQHDALDALYVGIRRKKVNWVLDADIRSFFDTLDHGWLVKFIEHRIADKRVLRLIQKWLNAGVLEDGKWSATGEGTPQGATISPLLANVYLHYVFDLWIQQWRKRRARGNIVVVRYADDFIVGFQHESEARSFLRDLRERLRRFALELHPEKTRLIRFGAFAAPNRKQRGEGKPETFCFLGFVHICSESANGKFLVVRHTDSSRMHRKLRELRLELRRRMHAPVPEQGAWLGSVVRGFDAYYAVPTNARRLERFRLEVKRDWLRALRRRSQRDRTSWQRIDRLCERWLPPARILHPWPEERFLAKTVSKSPVR